MRSDCDVMPARRQPPKRIRWAAMSNDARNVSDPIPARICLICAESFQSRGRARYCSPACRQRAFRLRRLQDRELARLEAVSAARPRGHLVGRTIYECPRCSSHYLGERRCPDCNLMCRRLGLGGECPHCAEPVLLADLIDGIEL